MKSQSLWQVTVTTSGEAEESVANLLEELFHLPATVFSDADTDWSRVTVYCPDRSVWTPAQRAALQAGLEHIRRCGLALGAGTVVAKAIRREAWAES
jgi:hypothetical protein